MEKFIFLFLLGTLPMSLHASEPLRQAEEFQSQMKYKQAIQLIDQVLRSPKSGPEQIVHAYRLMGSCMAGDGRSKKAVQYFRMLLAIDPNYRIPDTASPRVKAPFFKALSMGGDRPIALAHVPPAASRREFGSNLFLKVESNPFSLIRTVGLVFRTQADKPWRRKLSKLPKRNRIRFDLSQQVKGPLLEYYFEGINRFGGVVVSLGGETEAFRLTATTAEKLVAGKEVARDSKAKKMNKLMAFEEQPSTEESNQVPSSVDFAVGTKADLPLLQSDDSFPAWYQTWWFWTAVGVVVVGAGVGVGVWVASGGTDGHPGYEITLR